MRRDSEREDFQTMSDNELKELLRVTIKKYTSEKKTADSIAGVIFGIGFFVGIILLAVNETWMPLIIISVSSLVAGYLTETKMIEELNKKFLNQGFDVEKLDISAEWSYKTTTLEKTTLQVTAPTESRSNEAPPLSEAQAYGKIIQNITEVDLTTTPFKINNPSLTQIKTALKSLSESHSYIYIDKNPDFLINELLKLYPELSI